MCATHQLSQFMASPTEVHHRVGLHLLLYLKRSPIRGLFFPCNFDMQILGFSDVDWGTCVDFRHSISSYCFFIGSSVVAWKSKKPHTVSYSSVEVEYRVIASPTRELQWISYLICDLSQHLAKMSALYCDNQIVLHIVVNLIVHERTIHLDIDCHLVRKKA